MLLLKNSKRFEILLAVYLHRCLWVRLGARLRGIEINVTKPRLELLFELIMKDFALVDENKLSQR